MFYTHKQVRNFFSFTRSQSAVLITLLAVVVLGAAYILVYLPDKEKQISGHAFRTLQNVNKNVLEKIDNSASLLSNLLTAYRDTGKNAELKQYIQEYSTENFLLFQPRPSADSIKNNQTAIAVDYTSRQLTISINKLTGRSYTMLYMKYGFRQFIKPLLPQSSFDEYLVLGKGNVLYETFPSGITYLPDSLLQARNGISSSALRDLTIGGTGYKVFLQPVNFNDTNQWIVAGLITADHYREQKNQLPPRIVLLLITISLLISISFPWLKLYNMGSRDRLTIADGMLSFLVSMLLMSLLFFTFFRYNVPFRPDKTPDSKTILAQKISTAFTTEVSVLHDKLLSFDKLLSTGKPFQTDVANLGRRGISAVTPLNKQQLGQLNRIAGNSKLHQVFWLDEGGKERYNWTASATNSPHGNFFQRDYFQRILNRQGYIRNGDQNSQFYLEQVISWLTGSFRTVISAPSAMQVPNSTGRMVVALSADICSLEKTILPAGYSFILIDDQGKVLYHTDKTRNLNENVLKELSDADELRSAMQAHNKRTFLTSYYGKEYSVLVQPLKTYPYFILILSDIDYKETRDTEVFSFTIAMMFLFFAFLVAEALVVLLVSSKRSNFKKQRFATGWLGPKASSYKQYSIASVANGIIILLLALFFKHSTFAEYLFILGFAVTFTTILLNCVFAKRYYQEQNVSYFKHKLTTIYWLSGFILLINVAAFWKLDRPYGAFLLFEVCAVFFCFLLCRYGEKLTQKAGKKLGRWMPWNYKRSYALMALTRLVITSGIPVMFFYSASYNYEQNLLIRYRQLDFAGRLSGKYYQTDALKVAAQKNEAGYADSSWIRDVGVIGKLPPAERYTEEHRITIALFNLFRLYKNEHAVQEDHLHHTQAADSAFFYNHLLNDVFYNKEGSRLYAATARPGDYLSISSGVLNYRFPSLTEWRGWVFWLGFIILNGLFFLVILDVTGKLFASNLPNLDSWQDFDLKLLTTQPLNKLLFIIGLPGSGKLTWLLKKINSGEITLKEAGPLVLGENYYIADLLNMPDADEPDKADKAWETLKDESLRKQYKLVIVNHFEYNIKDAAANRAKLNYLEHLTLQNKAAVMILSTMHPVMFLDSLNEENAADSKSSLHDLERWNVLLGHYRILIHAIEHHTPAAASTSTRELISRETEYTHFLAKMGPAARAVFNTIAPAGKAAAADLFPLKLQNTSQYFYMYIWQSLTKEEKFLLYDLAEDGLVNTFDDHNLNMLISKGVIIRYDGALKLFNKGFRNFILTAIGNAELHKIKKDIKDNGNWSKLKTPLLVVFIAILTFLLASQQETYSKVIAYMSALAAAIPTLIKLFSMIEKAPQKASLE